jgi:nitronate monooxygenase
VQGMKRLEKSVLPNNYERLWCAGKSVELIDNILTCEEIIAEIKAEYKKSVEEVAQYK